MAHAWTRRGFTDQNNPWSDRAGKIRDRLALIRDKDVFISMLKQLGDLNLAETDPHWFNEMMFHDHPPLSKRIRFAQNFQDRS